MRLVFALFVTMIAVGCSGVDHLGSVGDVQFYGVHIEEPNGPNVTALVSNLGADEDGMGGKVSVEGVFSDRGIMHTVISALAGAAGEAGAAALYGHSLEFPDYEGDDVSISNDSGNNSASSKQAQGQKQSQGQSSLAVAASVNDVDVSNHNKSYNKNYNSNRNKSESKSKGHGYGKGHGRRHDEDCDD